MDINRIILGLLGLFTSTVIFFAGDPLMHGFLYTFCLEGEQDQICNNLLNGWNVVFPVFVLICFYLIISGGRDRDYPSEMYGGGY